MEIRGQSKYLEIGLLIVLSLLWGGSFTFIKVAVETVPPATIVLGRLVIGAALLMALLRLSGIRLPSDPGLWGAFLVQGFLQSALPFTLISWGEKYIDSGLASLLNATPPLFAFLIAFFMLKKDDASLRKFVGVVVGFIGVLVILGPDVLGGSSESVWGQLAITGASLSYAVAAIYAQRFSSQPALLTAACSMSMAALLMIPISLSVDRPWTLTPSGEALWSIAALGILSTTLAMIIYFRLVKTLGAVTVTSGSYLRAGFGIFLGILFLGENMTLSLVIGLVLIFLSLSIVTGQVRGPFGKRASRRPTDK